jgi:hypothetical protein
MTTYWTSDLAWLAHAIGYLGMALILFSLLYSLRKRKWLIRVGKLKFWLWAHHILGFSGGLIALVHTLGNLRGLGILLAALLVMLLVSSAVYFIERWLKRPLREATSRVKKHQVERDRLDAAYRAFYASGQAGTQQGRDLYSRLLVFARYTKEAEDEVKRLGEKSLPIGWWRHVHGPTTLLFLGVLLVHIWTKLYFRGGVL